MELFKHIEFGQDDQERYRRLFLSPDEMERGLVPPDRRSREEAEVVLSELGKQAIAQTRRQIVRETRGYIRDLFRHDKAPDETEQSPLAGAMPQEDLWDIKVRIRPRLGSEGVEGLGLSTRVTRGRTQLFVGGDPIQEKAEASLTHLFKSGVQVGVQHQENFREGTRYTGVSLGFQF